MLKLLKYFLKISQHISNINTENKFLKYKKNLDEKFDHQKKKKQKILKLLQKKIKKLLILKIVF